MDSTQSLWNLTLNAFRDQLASASPTPGGGSAAMVAAALGAALISMAVEVSIKKESHDPKLDSLPSRLKELIEALSAAADEDKTSFDAYIPLRAQIANRKSQIADEQAIAAALRRSGEAPLEGARRALAALAIAREAAPLVNKGIASDVACGAALLSAGIEAALATAEASLVGIKDFSDRDACAAVIQELCAHHLVLKEDIESWSQN